MNRMCNKHLKNVAEFSTFSSLEMNRMKSEAMWLGSKQNCTDTFFGFVWKRRLKILGVFDLPVTN